MRSPNSFFRISLATIVAFIVIAATFTTSHSQSIATQPATGTMAATSDGGAYPPCPAAIVTVATPASTSAATVAVTPVATTGPTATPTMTPAATMFVSTQAAPAIGCQLIANLSGTAEVPGPGATGSGTATLTITRPVSGPGQICFDIEIGGAGIKLPAVAAHIHMGAAKTAGPVVVPFIAPDVNGRAIGCTQNVDRDLIKQIVTHPDQFYVNVHTSDFPNGAIRGQLGTPVSYPPGQ